MADVTCNIVCMSVVERVASYRERMRASGFRPIQVWVPDVRTLSKEIAAQGRRVAKSDVHDGSLEWLDAVNADMWAEE